MAAARSAVRSLCDQRPAGRPKQHGSAETGASRLAALGACRGRAPPLGSHAGSADSGGARLLGARSACSMPGCSRFCSLPPATLVVGPNPARSVSTPCSPTCLETRAADRGCCVQGSTQEGRAGTGAAWRPNGDTSFGWPVWPRRSALLLVFAGTALASDPIATVGGDATVSTDVAVDTGGTDARPPVAATRPTSMSQPTSMSPPTPAVGIPAGATAHAAATQTDLTVAANLDASATATTTATRPPTLPRRDRDGHRRRRGRRHRVRCCRCHGQCGRRSRWDATARAVATRPGQRRCGMSPLWPMWPARRMSAPPRTSMLGQCDRSRRRRGA